MNEETYEINMKRFIHNSEFQLKKLIDSITSINDVI